jgi:hypothetical protein
MVSQIARSNDCRATLGFLWTTPEARTLRRLMFRIEVEVTSHDDSGCGSSSVPVSIITTNNLVSGTPQSYRTPQTSTREGAVDKVYMLLPRS